MSRRSRRQSKISPERIDRLIDAAIERRLSMMGPPAVPRNPRQDALWSQMVAQQAPASQGTPMFPPGAPLAPQPGMALPQGPRGWQYPVGLNIYAAPRSTEAMSFDTLRNLAMLYDGIQLCEQVWLDTVAKLNLVIKPRPEMIAEGSANTAKYADRIRKYSDFFAYPDQGNGYDLKAWLRAAVRDQLQIDAVAIYLRRNRGGGLYSMELVAGETIKPLIDPRGRRPAPPFPAYQQYIYGVPAGWYTSDDMIYLRETMRTESIYGLSRVERIILRVNQALRKENRDLAHYTDGNVPPGLLEPPDDGSQWTPEQLLTYQSFWDALLAGNDQARSRVKVVQPGSKYTALSEEIPTTDFDRFLLNTTCACYSMTMADLGFTENVNKSSGESQENVFYRRAVEPLMDRYATLFTQVLRQYFGEQDLVVSWSGFEESEDFNAMAASYVALTGAGITSPTVAARQLNIPWTGPEIPNYVLTKDGPVFLEDAADPAMRKAANDAKLAGLQFTQQNPGGPPKSAPGDDLAENDDAPAKKAAKGNGKQRQPSNSKQAKANPDDSDDAEADLVERIERRDQGEWRHPSVRQLALEAKLEIAIRDFIDQAKLSKDGTRLPDETAQETLLNIVTTLLEDAVHEGRRIATGKDERGLISAAKNVAGRAVQAVSGIMAQLRDKAQEIIDAIFHSGEESVPDGALDAAQESLDAWAAQYAAMVAETEIHAAVESAVLDELRAQGVMKVEWRTDGAPCEVCVKNAAASPLPIDAKWPSGDTAPPVHPHCRCTVAPAKYREKDIP
jgi:hypothetical protein